MLQLQLYQWSMLLLTSAGLVLAAPSTSYSFIQLHSCPICETQYDYDFTVAVQLALDNLELNNGATLNVNGSMNDGEMSHIMDDRDTALPIIQAIPIQVGGLNIPVIY